LSSTSTNKQPLLIDRPLLRPRSLAQTTCLAGTVDPGTTSNGALLLDCTGNDGALVESIWLLQRVADVMVTVNLYASTSAVALGTAYAGSQSEAWFIGSCFLPPQSKPGATTEFVLPHLLAPVPHAGGNDANGGLPQFRGLRVESGLALWAAAAVTAPNPDAPLIILQGGLY
jgi:hypothetical protein